MYYHLSTDANLQVLTPHIPETAVAIYEDVQTKRICFAKTISGCLSALQSIPEDYYVYIPDKKINVIIPTYEQVRDAKVTGEIWVLEETPVKCIGKIRSYDWERTKKYYYNNDEVTKFFYRWRWLEKN